MTQLDYQIPATRQATFSTPSVLSLVAAMAGFAVDRPLWALTLCIAAFLLGLLGVVVALMPNIRGGLLSMLSIVMGLIGMLVAVVRFIA